MGSYAPRSPDLSAYQSPSQQAPEPYRSDSFSLPQPSYYSSMPQPSYQYSQQQQQQPPQHQQPIPYNYNSAPSFPDYSQNPYNNGLRTPSAVKQEDPPWFPSHQGGHGSHVKVEPGTGRGRGGAAALKSEQSTATQIKNEPRVPAPGEEEGIVVKTKFPVARIKRIVQADEDVGKVAQVTPVVVSKALELFMISITLSAAAEARARGSKRVSGQHLKQAVQKSEQFDFLSDIVSRIPDAPASKEGKAKPEASDDEDFCDDDKKPKRGRPGAGAGARRKRRTKDDDDD